MEERETGQTMSLEKVRTRIYKVIEKQSDDDDDKLSVLYDYFMIFVIVLSLIPLCFKESTPLLRALDRGTVSIFIVDYYLRWMTADLRFGKRSVWSFIRYPFSVMALVDLFSILPSLTIIPNGFKILRLLRMFKALRVFRVIKAMRYSKNIEILKRVIGRSGDYLITVCVLAVGYIVVSAMVLFNVEPEMFDSFFDALYWSTITLTTVGYGDIYPVSVAGRVVTIISSFLGIAIVAMPAGIITAAYLTEIRDDKDEETQEAADPAGKEGPKHLDVIRKEGGRE